MSLRAAMRAPAEDLGQHVDGDVLPEELALDTAREHRADWGGDEAVGFGRSVSTCSRMRTA
jgi:hypothetical protein